VRLQHQRTFKTCWGSPPQVHTKGTDAMSWLVVFISLFVPIVLLFMVLIMGWLHGEPRAGATRRRTP
jgi:hypothetical protein